MQLLELVHLPSPSAPLDLTYSVYGQSAGVVRLELMSNLHQSEIQVAQRLLNSSKLTQCCQKKRIASPIRLDAIDFDRGDASSKARDKSFAAKSANQQAFFAIAQQLLRPIGETTVC